MISMAAMPSWRSISLNPPPPSCLGTLPAGGRVGGMAAAGDLLYFAAGSAGLQVARVNLSAPALPTPHAAPHAHHATDPRGRSPEPT